MLTNIRSEDQWYDMPSVVENGLNVKQNVNDIHGPLKQPDSHCRICKLAVVK